MRRFEGAEGGDLAFSTQFDNSRCEGRTETRDIDKEANMRLRVSTVTVKQLPETLNVKYVRTFIGELENVDRPRIVLDCSKIRQMDRSGSLLLLWCLEEAMKSNGDVKLAEVPNGARAILECTGVDRLFEIFNTTIDAVNSFRRLPVDAASHPLVLCDSLQVSENAA
jgi:anti-anti-sigma factor